MHVPLRLPLPPRLPQLLLPLQPLRLLQPPRLPQPPLLLPVKAQS